MVYLDLSAHPTCKKLHDRVHATVQNALQDMGSEHMPFCSMVAPQYFQTGDVFAAGVRFEITHPERKRPIKLSILMNTDGDFLVKWSLDDPDSLQEFTCRMNNALRVANCYMNERHGTYVFKSTVEDSRGFYLALRVKRTLEIGGIYASHAAENWTLDSSMWAAGQPVGAMHLKVTNSNNDEGLIIFMHSQSGGWTVMYVHDWFFDPLYEEIRISSEARFHEAIRNHKKEIEAI